MVAEAFLSQSPVGLIHKVLRSVGQVAYTQGDKEKKAKWDRGQGVIEKGDGLEFQKILRTLSWE